MTWGKGYRASPEFLRLRPRVLREAGYKCEITGCNNPANEVDHKLNLKSGGTDSRDNLQAICTMHHRQKSSLEGVRARKIKPRRRPAEDHPGWK